MALGHAVVEIVSRSLYPGTWQYVLDTWETVTYPSVLTVDENGGMSESMQPGAGCRKRVWSAVI